jgi:hypothetical protein
MGHAAALRSLPGDALARGPLEDVASWFEGVARGTICRFDVTDAMTLDYVFRSVDAARLGATDSGGRAIATL